MRHTRRGAIWASRGAWTPESITLHSWFDADDASTFTFGTGTTVSRWDDKSGNGYDVGQSTAGQRPDRSGTINGHTSVVFDGTNDVLYTPSAAEKFGVSHPFTVMLVAKNTDSGGSARTAVDVTDAPWESAGGEGRIRRTGSDDIVGQQGATLDSGVNWGTSNPRAVVMVFNQASSKIAVDGSGWTTGDAGSSSWGGGWMLGAWGDATNIFGGYLNEFWQGDICEVVAYEGVLSDGNRDGFFAYAASKWGTAN